MQKYHLHMYTRYSVNTSKSKYTLYTHTLLKYYFFFFYVRYSTLLHLPPLRFHCVGGCWDRTKSPNLQTFKERRLHRLAELIPWNRFLGSLNVYKFGLRTVATLALTARRSNHSARSLSRICMMYLIISSLDQ